MTTPISGIFSADTKTWLCQFCTFDIGHYSSQSFIVFLWCFFFPLFLFLFFWTVKKSHNERDQSKEDLVPLSAGWHLTLSHVSTGEPHVRGLPAWRARLIQENLPWERQSGTTRVFLKGHCLKKPSSITAFHPESPLKPSVLADSHRWHLTFYVMIICFYCLFLPVK